MKKRIISFLIISSLIFAFVIFYKGLNKVDQLQNKEFATFVELNKKVNYIATEQYRKPESGR